MFLDARSIQCTMVETVGKEESAKSEGGSHQWLIYVAGWRRTAPDGREKLTVQCKCETRSERPRAKQVECHGEYEVLRDCRSVSRQAVAMARTVSQGRRR